MAKNTQFWLAAVITVLQVCSSDVPHESCLRSRGALSVLSRCRNERSSSEPSLPESLCLVNLTHYLTAAAPRLYGRQSRGGPRGRMKPCEESIVQLRISQPVQVLLKRGSNGEHQTRSPKEAAPCRNFRLSTCKTLQHQRLSSRYGKMTRGGWLHKVVQPANEVTVLKGDKPVEYNGLGGPESSPPSFVASRLDSSQNWD